MSDSVRIIFEARGDYGNSVASVERYIDHGRYSTQPPTDEELWAGINEAAKSLYRALRGTDVPDD